MLCGFCKLDDVINKSVFGNLDCIWAGEIPTSSTELLMSDEMSNMIDELSKRYDYVFIDTPPILTVTDAMILAPKCNGVVVVAKQEQSTFDMLDKAIDVIKQSGVRILGFILNSSSETSNSFWKSGQKKKYTYHYQAYND